MTKASSKTIAWLAKLANFRWKLISLMCRGRSDVVEDLLSSKKAKSYAAGQFIRVPGLEIEVEPRHPSREIHDVLNAFADFRGLTPKEAGKKPLPANFTSNNKLINCWYSQRFSRYIYIEEEYETKKRIALMGEQSWITRNRLQSRTFYASGAWDVDSEMNALNTLRDKITENQFNDYFTGGSFVEKSKSGGYYIIRKSKPTIYCSSKGRVITCLCLHAGAYYRSTFAGCLTPTDDAITHLLMIRNNEHKFWRKANQHEPYLPTSGI